MAQKKAFLLRIDPAVLAAVQKWAEADLRSLNGQIEYLLRQALAKRGVRLPEGDKGREGEGEKDETGSP
jgi:hypothetical protein